MINRFFALFESILIPILTDWITSLDLCYLDTAVCNKYYRPTLQTILGKCKVFYHQSPSTDVFLEWLLLRRIQVKSLIVDPYSTIPWQLLHKQLLCVESGDNDNLEKLLDSSNTIDALKLTVGTRDCSIPRMIHKIGHILTHITFARDFTPDIFQELSILCPTLRSITCYAKSHWGNAILPLVMNCQLERIQACNVKYLTERQLWRQALLCDLVRVPVLDEDAVCLGDDKYYHVASINLHQDVQFMNGSKLIHELPPLRHVHTITLPKDLDIAEKAAAVCHRLTSLTVVCLSVVHSAVLDLVSKSHSLVYLSLTDAKQYDGTSLIEVTGNNCPLLERCCLKRISVDTKGITHLFRQCKGLSEFSCSEQIWDYDAVLDLAVNVEKFAFKRCLNGVVRKEGRNKNKLVIETNMSENSLIKLVQKNSGIRSLELFDLSYQDEYLLQCVVDECPAFTKISIHNTHKIANWQPLLGVTPLVRLDSLTSVNFVNLTVKSESDFLTFFANKRCLREMAMIYCDPYGGATLSLIANICSDLRYLQLNGNHFVKDSHIIELLTKCKCLSELLLFDCCNVTSEILPCAQSLSLRKVCISQCGRNG